MVSEIAPMKTNRSISALLAAALVVGQLHADVLPPLQDTSSLNGKLTAATGKATTLPVTGTRKAFVLFNLNSIPQDVLPGEITNARLRVYFAAALRPGDIAVHPVVGAWDEKTVSLEPAIDPGKIATFPTGMVVAKKFLEVDVTATVQGWRTTPASNQGFAFVASGLTNVLLGAKEGPASGYPCELEVEIDHTDAVTFTGPLVGDITGTQGATVVSTVGGSTAALLHSAELLANAATNLNTDGTIVRRDATGVSLPFFRTVTSQNGPTFQSANIIAGSTINSVAAGVTGAVIAGGGATNGFPQLINANYSCIGGGYSNTIGANGGQSTIAGGVGNTANAGGVAIGGGQSNTGGGNFATIGGGQNNQASGANSMIPGGNANTASGANSFAAGSRAKATHPGSFVWGDSTAADVNSTANDQMTIRANGGVVINTSTVAINATGGLGVTVNATNAVSVPVGTVYKDNTVVAWGRVNSNSLSDAFNVAGFVRNSAGNYTITLNTSFTGTALLPVASPCYVGAPPTTAAGVRIASTGQLLSNTTFNVYLNSGTFAAADGDFTFIVTGR